MMKTMPIATARTTMPAQMSPAMSTIVVDRMQASCVLCV